MFDDVPANDRRPPPGKQKGERSNPDHANFPASVTPSVCGHLSLTRARTNFTASYDQPNPTTTPEPIVVLRLP